MAEHRTIGQAGRWAITAGAILVVAMLSVWALARPSDDPFVLAFGAANVVVRNVTNSQERDPADGANWQTSSLRILSADTSRGHTLIRMYGCGACHSIPGVINAHGTVGPSLRRFAARGYIGGVLPNRPDNLVGWLIDPPLHVPRTAMPDMGITQEEARDMAAYLYTLREE